MYITILLAMLLPEALNAPTPRQSDIITIPHEPTHIQHIHILPSKYARKKKAPNLAVIPLSHQLYLPAKFHVVPQSNVQSSVHTSLNHIISNNVRIPVVTQTVAHSTNITHPSVFIIPLQHNLVPVHDLSVIPLQRDHVYRKAMDKSDEEEPNPFRTYYGGYGTGLLFGGHGAGHGFYAYGHGNRW